ncbi:hypothetical protein JR316_0008032 [Psilocybe cubensis]|uniref:Nudix hydrolase domain-containing protein n=2 Tax=Psilocybe cubensis TaxID=181762 RepID=A0A8H7XVE1_PSICU|nr:hypothetical protein JR316_0008032 [Psilocybe cubensis]KAH9479438.1 hypothetical protein JR316_0008032 [Psilocybe cubensis]
MQSRCFQPTFNHRTAASLFRTSAHRLSSRSTAPRNHLQSSSYVALYHSYPPGLNPVKPLKLPREHHSLLPLVHSCNNLILSNHPWHSDTPHTVATRTAQGDLIDQETVVPFVISHDHRDYPAVGFIRPQVAAALEEDHQKHLVSGSASPWDLRYSKELPKVLKAVAFAPWVNEGGKYTRTMHMERLIYDWRKHDVFSDILKGWSDEAYPVYTHAPQQISTNHDPIAFAIERAALPLFGLVNFGVLLTAYVRDPSTGRIQVFIPRRSLNKRTWPGKLDVTVVGGMGLGESAMDTILHESVEEALLDHDYVKEHIQSVGGLPFPNRSPKGWIIPGMYYLYDLELPPDGSLTPRINALDGEVEAFELLDVQNVLQNLVEGRFKPSSAMAIVDFLIRHGYLTEDTDPRYLDVCRILKTDIKLPVAWRSYP